ncbi:RNA polymerase sigma factor [Corallococcus sp. RDP092CA]|uniref:RNA polymerase sigma factor n=1 Tax=Corallococcus sp. RDP092CA TaxID=3109369 RepID=UPI0035B078BF
MSLSPGALDSLLRHRHAFLAFLTPRVGSREAAREVLQAAFVKGMEQGDSLRDEQRAVAWLYRLLRNALVDRYRRGQREAMAPDALAPEQPLSTEDTAGLEAAVCGSRLRAWTPLRASQCDVGGHTSPEVPMRACSAGRRHFMRLRYRTPWPGPCSTSASVLAAVRARPLFEVSCGLEISLAPRRSAARRLRLHPEGARPPGSRGARGGADGPEDALEPGDA